MNLALERWSRSDQHDLNEIMGFDDDALPTQSDRPIKEVMTIIGLEDDEDLSTIADDTVNETVHESMNMNMNRIFVIPTNRRRMLLTPEKKNDKSGGDHDTLPETPPKNFNNSLESKSHEDEFNRQWSKRFIRLLSCASILGTILLGSIAVLSLNLYSIRNSDSDSQEQVESSSIAADGTSQPFDFSYLTESPTITPTPSPTMLRATPSPTKSPVIPRPPTYAPSLITPTLATPNLTLGPTSTIPMTVLDTIRESILRASPNSAATLFDEQSVQYNVLEWLVEDPALDNYTEAKRLQRFALATLHGSLSRGMDQFELSPTTGNWMTYTDECTWTLTRDQLCDETGKVTSIYLENLNLKGTLPPELGLLSDSLEFLFLSSNAIAGEIPKEIGQLTLLQRMQIPRNKFGGSIPSEIGLLSNLGVLAFGTNNLIGDVPTELGRLQQLGFLGLQNNNLKGTIPTELSQLTGLSFLSLESNFLSGQVPEGLGSITVLESLRLQQNELVGLMPEGICKIRGLELSADCDEVECDCCSDCCFDCIRVTDPPAVASPPIPGSNQMDIASTEAPTAFTTEPIENECVSIQALNGCYTQDQAIEVAVSNCDVGEFDLIALYEESIGDNISYRNAVFWVNSCGLEECDGIMADGLIYFDNQDPGNLGFASWPLSQDSYKMHLLRINPGGEVVSLAESDPFRIDDTC